MKLYTCYFIIHKTIVISLNIEFKFNISFNPLFVSLSLSFILFAFYTKFHPIHFNVHVSGVISLHYYNQKTLSMLLKVSPLTRVNGPTGMDFWTMSNCNFCRKSSFLLKSWTFKGTNSASRQILNTSNLLGSCQQKITRFDSVS